MQRKKNVWRIRHRVEPAPDAVQLPAAVRPPVSAIRGDVKLPLELMLKSPTSEMPYTLMAGEEVKLALDSSPQMYSFAEPVQIAIKLAKECIALWMASTKASSKDVESIYCTEAFPPTVTKNNDRPYRSTAAAHDALSSFDGLILTRSSGQLVEAVPGCPPGIRVIMEARSINAENPMVFDHEFTIARRETLSDEGIDRCALGNSWIIRKHVVRIATLTKCITSKEDAINFFVISVISNGEPNTSSKAPIRLHEKSSAPESKEWTKDKVEIGRALAELYIKNYPNVSNFFSPLEGSSGIDDITAFNGRSGARLLEKDVTLQIDIISSDIAEISASDSRLGRIYTCVNGLCTNAVGWNCFFSLELFWDLLTDDDIAECDQPESEQSAHLAGHLGYKLSESYLLRYGHQQIASALVDLFYQRRDPGQNSVAESAKQYERIKTMLCGASLVDIDGITAELGDTVSLNEFVLPAVSKRYSDVVLYAVESDIILSPGDQQHRLGNGVRTNRNLLFNRAKNDRFSPAYQTYVLVSVKGYLGGTPFRDSLTLLRPAKDPRLAFYVHEFHSRRSLPPPNYVMGQGAFYITHETESTRHRHRNRNRSQRHRN